MIALLSAGYYPGTLEDVAMGIFRYVLLPFCIQQNLFEGVLNVSDLTQII